MPVCFLVRTVPIAMSPFLIISTHRRWRLAVEALSSTQADYNLSLAAVPTGPSGPTQDTLLYVGTIDLYRCSLSAGCVLRNTTNALNGCATSARVAPAQHAIATLATPSQPLLYLGNDGGLWRSTDGVNEQAATCSADDATHFQNLNGGLGSLAEVISFAQHPTDSAMLLVGLGANGTAATSTAFSSTTAWPQLSGGEGGTVAIDQSNPLLWYVSTAAGVSIRQCPDGGACTSADFTGSPTIGSAQVAGDDSIIHAPWLLDPALASNVLIGTCRVWRGPAADGALWSSSNAISNCLVGRRARPASAPILFCALSQQAVLLTADTTQNGGSQVLYAGMAGNARWRRQLRRSPLLDDRRQHGRQYDRVDWIFRHRQSPTTPPDSASLIRERSISLPWPSISHDATGNDDLCDRHGFCR